MRLLLTNPKQESLTAYTDGFRADEPLDEDDDFDHEYVVHSDGEYVGEEVHINTCEGYGSLLRPWLPPHFGVLKDKLTQYLRAFQLCRELCQKPGTKSSNTLFEVLFEINNVLHKRDFRNTGREQLEGPGNVKQTF